MCTATLSRIFCSKPLLVYDTNSRAADALTSSIIDRIGALSSQQSPKSHGMLVLIMVAVAMQSSLGQDSIGISRMPIPAQYLFSHVTFGPEP